MSTTSPTPRFHSQPDQPATTPESPQTSMRAVVRDGYGSPDVLSGVRTKIGVSGSSVSRSRRPASGHRR